MNKTTTLKCYMVLIIMMMIMKKVAVNKTPHLRKKQLMNNLSFNTKNSLPKPMNLQQARLKNLLAVHPLSIKNRLPQLLSAQPNLLKAKAWVKAVRKTYFLTVNLECHKPSLKMQKNRRMDWLINTSNRRKHHLSPVT